MKKPFTLLAFRKERKTLGFVLPVDSGGHDNFRAAKALPRTRRGYGRKVKGGYPLKDGLIEFQLLRQPFQLRTRMRQVRWVRVRNQRTDRSESQR
jgi:hypothetical protein